MSRTVYEIFVADSVGLSVEKETYKDTFFAYCSDLYDEDRRCLIIFGKAALDERLAMLRTPASAEGKRVQYEYRRAELVLSSFSLPVGLHRDFKIATYANKESMGDVITRYVQIYVKSV